MTTTTTASHDDDPFRQTFLAAIRHLCQTDREFDAQVSRRLGVPSIYSVKPARLGGFAAELARVEKMEGPGAIPDYLPEEW